MRKLTNALLALTLLAMLNACTDETIGTSLTDSRVNIIVDSSFIITGKSVANPRLQAKTSTQLVGHIKSDGYGTLRSDVVTQMMPATQLDTAKVTLDSCRFKFRVPLAQGFTGDSLTPMRMTIYRLTKALPSPMYSDFDPTGYYDTDKPLASGAYSPSAAVIDYDAQTREYYRAVHVPVSIDFAKELFDKYKTSPEIFSSLSKFNEYFPGIYITNSYGSGRMMNFSRTEFEVYYQKHVISGDIDSIYTGQRQTYLAASPEMQQDNIINLEIDPSISTRVANGEAIVMAPAGYEVQIRFPIDEIIQRVKNDIGSNLAVINDLELDIPVEDTGTEYDIAPPQHLLFIKTAFKDNFLANDSLTNDKDSFYATYEPTNKTYHIEDMRNYILDILDHKGGVPTDADIEMTITPVDVTTYTATTSYSTSTTVITTKIAPQVSAPALARLRLDKAKVKITYSKQTL